MKWIREILAMQWLFIIALSVIFGLALEIVMNCYIVTDVQDLYNLPPKWESIYSIFNLVNIFALYFYCRNEKREKVLASDVNDVASTSVRDVQTLFELVNYTKNMIRILKMPFWINLLKFTAFVYLLENSIKLQINKMIFSLFYAFTEYVFNLNHRLLPCYIFILNIVVNFYERAMCSKYISNRLKYKHEIAVL